MKEKRILEPKRCPPLHPCTIKEGVNMKLTEIIDSFKLYWTLNFGLGFGTWIWDLGLGLKFESSKLNISFGRFLSWIICVVVTL